MQAELSLASLGRGPGTPAVWHWPEGSTWGSAALPCQGVRAGQGCGHLPPAPGWLTVGGKAGVVGTLWCHPRAFGDGADGAQPQGTGQECRVCVGSAWVSQTLCPGCSPRPGACQELTQFWAHLGAVLWGLQVLCPSAKSEEPREVPEVPESALPQLLPCQIPGHGRGKPPAHRLPHESLFLQPQSSLGQGGVPIPSWGLCPGPTLVPSHKPLSPHRPHSVHGFTKHIG